MRFMNGAFDSLRQFLASPTFTGTPAGPTAAPGTNTTQLATTAFVHDEVAAVPQYTVNDQTAAAPAAGDYLGGYDTSATAEKKFLAEEVAALAIGSGGTPGNSGYFYGPGLTSGASAALLVANRVIYTYFALGAKTTWTRIGVGVQTAAAASTIRLGIYKWENGAPGARVVDCGTIDSSTTGEKEITIDVTLEPGFYALACVSGGDPSAHRATGAVAALAWALGSANALSSTSNYYCYEDTGSAALPTPAGTVTFSAVNTTVPALWLRKV